MSRATRNNPPSVARWRNCPSSPPNCASWAFTRWPISASLKAMVTEGPAMIRVEIHPGWHRLVLNRPAKLNALTTELITQLLAAIDAAEADTACRVVILTGEGRGFCAGQELGPEVMPGPD